MPRLSQAGAAGTARPLIAHVVFRFDYGGLENGIVNLINGSRDDRFRHCVIALTEATEFRHRLRKPGVEVHALAKRPGKDPAAYWRLYRLLRRLRPAILHTRNVGTLDCALFGRLAGVPACVHGEHGWDTHDPDGTNRKYRRLRRGMQPLVSRFVTVSQDLRQWLTETVGIPSRKVTRICNGVDTQRFHPGEPGERAAEIASRFAPDAVIVGSVLRFNEIKDPMNLVEAFIPAFHQAAEQGTPLSLIMLGDGPLREHALATLESAGVAEACWLPGSRDDVPSLMRSFDLFVLGSRREGISNTLLEAMATGLPLVATDTGGNRELVQSGFGVLVPPGDRQALAGAIHRYTVDSKLREQHGAAARRCAGEQFSMDSMLEEYERVYADVVGVRA